MTNISFNRSLNLNHFTFISIKNQMEMYAVLYFKTDTATFDQKLGDPKQTHYFKNAPALSKCIST